MLTIKKLFPIFLFIFISGTFIILNLAFDIKRIEGDSMCPTLNKGEYILVDILYTQIKLFSSKKPFFFGDILTFKIPQKKDILIKRVIGVEGDELIWLDEETFFLNDVKITVPKNKNYLFKDFTKIPKHGIFFLGDNQSQSVDSRHFGFVSIHQVHGKVLFKE